jgi:high-affinity Fe2+/Pb2+ permease
MRNLILVGALALLLLSPLTAAAQQRTAPAVPSTTEGVSTAKVVAIGVGALLGSVVAQTFIIGEGVGLVGAAAGGLLAWWWYDNSSGGTNRAAMREPIGAPSLANAERLAMAR